MRCSFARASRLNGKLKMRCEPCCSTPRFSTWSGARGIGASGSPTLPQALKKTKRQGDKETRRRAKTDFSLSPCLLFSLSPCLSGSPALRLFLQNVSAEIFILHDIGQHLANVSGVDNLAFLFQIGAFERNLVEDFLEDRVQAARAYVFSGLVHPESEVGHF